MTTPEVMNVCPRTTFTFDVLSVGIKLRPNFNFQKPESILSGATFISVAHLLELT